jgi:SAM-dependent methyltransferase
MMQLEAAITGTAASPVLHYPDLFVCPACAATLRAGVDGHRIECTGCGRSFTIDNGIPLLFWPTEGTSKRDVTDVVRAFYEKTPFPNYDDMDSPESLRAKADQGYFSRLLNDQISHGSTILECGCGTGQLSNFLGLTWGRTVLGTDICLNSLRLGQSFKSQHGIEGTHFVQMNLFRPVFRPESFDFVISNGVLHHTSDPFAAFRSILRCVKKGGFIVVGLYNTYGRLTTDFRRHIFRLTGDRFAFLDPRLRLKHLGNIRKQAWFNDQYKHPHESKHTFGEVLNWFDQSRVEFVNSIPRCTAADLFSRQEKLFKVHSRGISFDHFIVQMGMLFSGGREGGFFIMIGRKKAEMGG